MSQPLYQVVYDEIIKRIVDGSYPPGNMLPSEFDLGAELGVSQGTARKALTELEKKKIVERRQGRGTFVTLRTPENSMFHFFRLRTLEGDQVVPEPGTEKVLRRPSNKYERAALFGNPRSVFEISRVRNFRGEPLSQEVSIVPTNLFPGLPDRAPLPNTLYVLFQQAYSCVIIWAEDSLRAGVLGEKLAEKLDTEPSKPVLIAERKSYDLQGRVVELRTSTFITDKVTYSVRME